MARSMVLWFIRSARCIGIGLLLLAAVLPSGCKRSTTIVGPKGEKVTMTKDGGEVSFKGQNGEEVHFAGGKKDVALPADFPSDVAIYPKATVALSSTADQGMTVMLHTADSAEKAKTFYDEKLKKDGWKIENTLNTPAGAMMVGSKDGRTLTVLVASDSDKTSIHLTVTKKAK
jgi:hypothetical protein